ncbi:Dipeptide transport system permease protein DppB [Pseudovibrio sp. W64]|uniref:ABC transporter permease n=1 Tax=unclassified Pseudovibrio TaxID=2627060 RepID=UPI0007AEB567|nr:MULTISPECIES: ABC transporter permease [unclassified Pseudovibrio]KZK78601.1 Dipeptide transport system permease protein DppB [Pseudovibrio sp. W64]KZL07962.1 Dipeptide transport system permease protein DppB [Pseudovibrio sp. Ad14]
MGLLRFLAQRAAATLVLLVGISIVSFAIIQAVPGDYVDMWMATTAAQTGQSRAVLEPQAEILRTQLGLDQPVVVQYWRWIVGIVTAGNFGDSFFFSKPVTEVIGLRLPRTLALAFTAMVLAQFIGGALGVYAAMNQYKLGDTISTIVAFLGIVIPKFVISLIILYYLAFVWHSPYIGALQSPEYLLQDHWSLDKLWDFFKHVWPILLISIWAGQAYTLRMMRGNLLDVMKSQYIETARAKGLSRSRIILVHAIPNALHPVIMNIGSRFEYMVKGEIEIAIVLGVPTIGPLILSSVAERDMYVVAAIFMLVATIMVVGNLVADLLLALIDPRVRQAAMEGNA